jgi:hypothetical protein
MATSDRFVRAARETVPVLAEAPIPERSMLNIDSADRELIALVDVPALLPRRRGRRLHPSTVHRWIRHGIRGHRLSTVLVGGRTFVSRRGLTDFLERVNGSRPSAAADAAPTALHLP